MRALSEQRQVNAPSGCARIIQRVNAGTYFLRIERENAHWYRLNYAAHAHGTCGDGVVDPTELEVCDQGTRTSGYNTAGTCRYDCSGVFPQDRQDQFSDIQRSWGEFSNGTPVRVSCVSGLSSAEFSVYDMDGHYIHHQDMNCLPGPERSGFDLHVPGGFRITAKFNSYRAYGVISVTPRND